MRLTFSIRRIMTSAFLEIYFIFVDFEIEGENILATFLVIVDVGWYFAYCRTEHLS